MTINEAEQIKDVQETTSADNASPALASEAASQLSDFVQARPSAQSSDRTLSSLAELQNISFGVSEKDKAKAIESLGTSLGAMVAGDLTHVRERLQQLGLDTTQVDAKIKEAEEKAAEAKPLQDALLKGDVAALQKLVADTPAEKLAGMVDLIQKHFDKAGIGMQVELSNGQLIVSGNKADRAIAISKDKLDVIGINADGSYDFTRQYRRENPTAEMQGLAERSLSNYIHPPRQWYYKDMHNSSSNMGHAIQNSLRQQLKANPR